MRKTSEDFEIRKHAENQVRSETERGKSSRSKGREGRRELG